MLLRAVECTLQKAVAETFSGWQKWFDVFSRVTRICMKNLNFLLLQVILCQTLIQLDSVVILQW